MLQTRRQFLRKTAYYGLGAATASAVVNTLTVTNALAQPGSNYKALVCIFMGGGNDSNNMIVPADAGAAGTGLRYADYAAARSAQQLALPPYDGTTTPVNRLLQPVAPANLGGLTFSFHPSLTGLRTLYTQGRVAVVNNVGPLVFPMTKAQYQNGSVQRPYQLFSHSDQVEIYQTAIANTRAITGWGGRLGDQTRGLFDPSGSFPMATTVAGSNVFGLGVTTRPLSISSTGLLSNVLVLSGFGTGTVETARKTAFNNLRTRDRNNTITAAGQDITQTALNVDTALDPPDPVISTVFPTTTLGNQLLQVAKVMKANLTKPALFLNRQIFFASFGGFDTHGNQLNGQGGFANGTNLVRGLLGQLNDAMVAFYNATVELGVQNQVTTFTLADFSRTFNPAGTGASTVGSDHAWGSHQFVMGNAVAGNNFYGKVGPFPGATIFPALLMGATGPQDTGTRGSWIPNVSVEQYAATLARWYGLPAADLPIVFPLLNRFSPTTLGFLPPF